MLEITLPHLQCDKSSKNKTNENRRFVIGLSKQISIFNWEKKQKKITFLLSIYIENC